MNINAANPAKSLPPALYELFVMLTLEKYRPELVDKATAELGGIVGELFVQQAVNKANAKTVEEFGPVDINKSYFVYDRDEGWHVARPYPVKNLAGLQLCVNWELPHTDELLVRVTHIAELPANPLA